MPNPSTPTPPIANFAGFVSSDDTLMALHRFDSPHLQPEEPVSSLGPVSSLELGNRSEPGNRGDRMAPELSHEIDATAIRAAHADDLVEFLQRWSEELDARSARLHADMATHERRERAFRLWMQNRRSEHEAQLADFLQAQSRVEAAARRFAIELEP